MKHLSNIVKHIKHHEQLVKLHETLAITCDVMGVEILCQYSRPASDAKKHSFFAPCFFLLKKMLFFLFKLMFIKKKLL